MRFGPDSQHLLGKPCSDLLFEFWQVVLDDRPHDVIVDGEVAMNEDIAHADDLGPRRVRVLITKGVGESRCGIRGTSMSIYEQAVVKTVAGFLAGIPNIYSASPIRGASKLRTNRVHSP
jgi:hypothetical protein